jgi:ATP-binding cassette subfamily B protein
MWRAQSRITVQDMLLFALLEIAVIAVAGLQLARGQITPGDLLAASQYVALAATLSAVVPSLSRLIRARSAAARIHEVLVAPPTAYGQIPLPPSGGRIQFRDVTVRSGDRAVLTRVNLIIQAGAHVALVGRSGSGKSLLARLIGRLADPDEGAVLLDWVPLPQLDRGELRRAVGYGFERPALVGDTLADAIAFGTDRPELPEVIGAAQAARADDFIRRMPGGYGTPLADAPMSGGELQRMGLARTFAHANRVLVLDDVAASLDTVTDHEISMVLTVGMAGRTRVLVAHRASTAARADAVIWLDGGGVRAVAPHRELWLDPDYRALFEAAEPPQDAALPHRVSEGVAR